MAHPSDCVAESLAGLNCHRTRINSCRTKELRVAHVEDALQSNLQLA